MFSGGNSGELMAPVGSRASDQSIDCVRRATQSLNARARSLIRVLFNVYPIPDWQSARRQNGVVQRLLP